MVVQKPVLRHLDYSMIVTVLLICFLGIFAIKSAKHTDAHALDFVRKQAVGVVLGAAAMLGVGIQEYERLRQRWVQYLYVGNILMLLAVLSPLAHSSHGAQRWISLGPIIIQPSEFAKVILICTLALYLSDNIETIREWPTVIKSLIHIGVPMLLIAKQPDLGTSLVLLAIWFGMMSIAGARPAHLASILLAGVLLFAAMWHFNIVLKDYQKNRLEVFLNPDADPRDTGYHLRQSEIAIGSGEMSGEGYGKGRQSNGRFIPEQHTDFIFTIVGEEGGFIVCVVLLGLYLFVLERGVRAMAICDDPLGRILAAGVLSMLTFHTVVNAGMTMGVMPVVGVPLPFFSYGLSSLLVNLTGVGLLLSVGARKGRVMF